MSDQQVKKGKRFADALGNTKGHRNMNGRNNKDRRREEAFKRQDAFSQLSITEKLKSLGDTGAARQRARYTELLNKQNEKASQTSQLIKDAREMVEKGEAVSLSEAKRKLTEKKQAVKA